MVETTQALLPRGPQCDGGTSVHPGTGVKEPVHEVQKCTRVRGSGEHPGERDVWVSQEYEAEASILS